MFKCQLSLSAAVTRHISHNTCQKGTHVRAAPTWRWRLHWTGCSWQPRSTLTRPCGTETRAGWGEGRYIDIWRYRQYSDWQEVLIKSPAAGKPAPLMTICTIKHLSFSSCDCAPKGSLFILYISIIFRTDALCVIAHRMFSVKGHLQVVEQNSNWFKMYVLKCIKMFPVQLLENNFLHNLSAIKLSFFCCCFYVKRKSAVQYTTCCS